jgi:hypothetical protein
MADESARRAIQVEIPGIGADALVVGNAKLVGRFPVKVCLLVETKDSAAARSVEPARDLGDLEGPSLPTPSGIVVGDAAVQEPFSR